MNIEPSKPPANVTVTGNTFKSFQPGQVVSITIADQRWWVRFWHWITFRPPPQRTHVHTVVKVTENTFSIQEKGPKL